MQGYEIRFNIYAETDEEVLKAREVLINFIDYQAKNGRAVSASKIIEAMSRLEKNPFIKNQVNKFFN